ncbi:cytochrome b5-related protein-like [Onthophagus taurus]|uniref:cytochrome b5-related protein-like n=1 Tax=Onthophagus taurus TaxID=166361 RepID=UPI0039BE1C2C
MPPNTDGPKSSLGFKYPSLRDCHLKTCDNWLEGKRIDDNINGLWRIHDKLYDFSDFINLHPGGKDWLILTKGTDITEAFECHHLNGKAENLLGKYLKKSANFPRQSPFTFQENGFYRTLKKRVQNEIKNIPESYSHKSKMIIDTIFVIFMITSLLANSQKSYFFGIIAGVSLNFLAIAAHNFFHQKDNFRMYYFDLTLMSSRDWRVSHALSHHLFPNTINDLEISALEPFLQYLPHQKNFVARYLSWIYSPIFYTVVFTASSIRMIVQLIKYKKLPRKENFLPILYFFLIYFGSNITFMETLKTFFFIQSVASLFFGIIGINAAHHHPDIFHDGDASRSQTNLDWGIHQLDAVMDRKEILGSHFWVLLSFGDHGLHHLFPTIDHGKLGKLYPILQKTCKEFGVELKLNTIWGLTFGQFKQLSRIEPNRKPLKTIL